MIPAITKNPNERAQLAAYRQGGATIRAIDLYRGVYSVAVAFF